MFKTILPQAALTRAKPNLAVCGLALHDSNATRRSEGRFCALAALLLALILTLPGCGPGTGGTGVGPGSSTGGTRILFSGLITGISTTGADAVGLPGISQPTPGTTSNGGTSSASTCATDCSGITATLNLEGERVQLDGPCVNFVSQSPLTIDASGFAVLTGTYQTTGQVSNQTLDLQSGQIVTRSVGATLMLEFSDRQVDSSSVTIRVRDIAGALLFGPATLSRTSLAAGVKPSEPQTGGVLSCR